MPRSEKEGLLSRWSRLKRESGANAAAPGKRPTTPEVAAPPADVSARDAVGADAGSNALPELPSLESLTPDSDFQAFMDPRVEDGVRRAALKTLFRSPGFNVTDGLDEYAGDYSKLETLAPAMVAALRHTQRTLFGTQGESGDHGAARSDAIPSEGMQSTGENRNDVSHGDEQRDGRDPCAGETRGESTRRAHSTNAAEDDRAGGNAGERARSGGDFRWRSGRRAHRAGMAQSGRTGIRTPNAVGPADITGGRMAAHGQ